VLEELGLTAALTALFSEFTDLTGLPVRRRVVTPSGLTQEVELVIYRITQESLTNVARHADATSVDFSLEATEDGAALMTVADDGHGIAGPEGSGIRGMRERALLVHADLEITSRAGSGTVLSLSIPPRNEPSGRHADVAHAHPVG
jgi:two-component system sensor histidine kinase UhpB